MSQVVIPATPVPNPSRIITSTEYAVFNAQNNANRFQGAGFGAVAGESDPGFGYYGASGGAGSEGNFIQYTAPANELPQGEGFIELNNLLESALKRNWREQGRPGNPNILETYRVCGNNYGDDNTAWCAAFLSWALFTAGIKTIKSLSSLAFVNYGSEVDWRTWENVRANDIVVFRSKSRSGGHVGFFRGYNPSSRRVAILGGNQGNDYKLANFLVNSDLYVTNVKRNWSIPEKFDFPIISTQIASGTLESFASTR